MASALAFCAHSDLAITFTNNEIVYHASSHIVRLISTKWADGMVSVANNGDIRFTLDLQEEAMGQLGAFEHIMNIAHYRPEAVPQKFRLYELAGMEFMCVKYGLHKFLAEHCELLRRCFDSCSKLDKWAMVDHIDVTWQFGSEEQLSEVWVTLLRDSCLDHNGEVLFSDIDIEHCLGHSNQQCKRNGHHWPDHWIVLDESDMPRELLGALNAALRNQLNLLLCADVYRSLFDILVQNRKTDPPSPCKTFCKQNWGHLINAAHEDGAISQSMPLTIETDYAKLEDFSPKTLQGWKQAWIEHIGFEECDHGCGREVWGKVEKSVDVQAIDVPAELLEQFRNATLRKSLSQLKQQLE